MVSLQTVILVGGLATAFLFRNQIAEALKATGTKIGEGLGGAAGGVFGGFARGLREGLEPGTDPRTGEESFFYHPSGEPGLFAWLFNQFNRNGNNGIQTPDADQPLPEQTVTPFTREESDFYVPQTGRTAAQVASTLDPTDPRLAGLAAIATRVRQPESLTLSPLHYRPDNPVGVVLPDSIDQPQEDQTVTPYTREMSDMYTPQQGRSVAQVLSSLSPDDPRRKGLVGLLNR